MQRILDGQIGELVGGQCYWNMGELWSVEQSDGMSDMEWQCRNWLYFTWLSGDHICEQHVHNLDILNWGFGGPPVKAYGLGGRQKRVDPLYGNVFDHFGVEYEYANGARIMSMCRQSAGTSSRVSERLVGTKGTSNGANSIWGESEWKYEGEGANPYVEEHRHLIEAIRNNGDLNEGVQVAESTATAIMGRMSAYTGREISWGWMMNRSELDLSPAEYKMGPLPVRDVAIPGVTELS